MNFKQWLGQTTTGAGFATILATVGGFVTGSVGWQQALPLVVAGVAGLIWPENSPLQSATSKAAQDVETLVAAYQATKPAANATAAPTPPAAK